MSPPVAIGSSAYNLAGEPGRRPDFLKSQVVGHISSNSPMSIGETITRGYGGSSALRLRRFLKWSQTDSEFLSRIGVTGGSLPGGDLDLELIKGEVPPWDEDEEVTMVWNNTFVGPALPEMWVVQYMARYHPADEYTYTFDPETELATIYRDGEDDIILVLPGYYPWATYLYVRYFTAAAMSYWYIYQYSTGNAVLDEVIASTSEVALGSFYPPIPFRFLNQPVAIDSPDATLVDLYPTCKLAFKKAFGLGFDDVQEKILDNESIEDIDYIYAVMSVTLNTPENSGRKYVFKLFEYLAENTITHTAASKANWYSNYSSGSWPGLKPPWKSFKVSSMVAGVSNYRTDIKWAFLVSTSGTGLLKPGAKTDELWFEVLPDPVGTFPATYEYMGFQQEVALCWQVTKDSWKKIVLTGLQYNNYVYVTDHTLVTAKTALQTLDKDSEFLVPLHEGIFDSLPMVDALQVGTSCSWLVFNCFEIHKEEWYESDWFRVLIFAVILAVAIVAAVVTGGASLGVGGSAAVGFLTGAGLGVTASLIIAAAVDVVAGILISYLIGLIATELFGEKWGPLIGAIVTFLFTFGMSVGSLSEALSALGRADTWVALGTATGNGVAGYLQGQAAQVAEDTAKMMEDIGEKNAEVQRMYNELMAGSSNGVDLSVISRYKSDLSERPSEFLTRTLVTGSDIVEITLKQIEDFTRNNLKLEMV